MMRNSTESATANDACTDDESDEPLPPPPPPVELVDESGPVHNAADSVAVKVTLAIAAGPIPKLFAQLT